MTTPPPEASDASLAHLLGRLAAVEVAVRSAVAARRAGDATPDDPFRGLYLSDDDIDRLLEERRARPLLDDSIRSQVVEVERRVDAAEGDAARLTSLAARFGLDDVDVRLLLICMAPDLDMRFERFYGYLQDDVTRRRASVGLALELCGLPTTSASARDRLAPGGRLVDAALIELEEQDRPTLGRPLLVPDRVTGHLLGSDLPDHLVAGMLVTAVGCPGPVASSIGRVVGRGGTFLYLQERLGGSGHSSAAAGLRAAGVPLITADLDRLVPATDVGAMARALSREARLSGGALVAGPIEVLTDRGDEFVRAFAELPGLVLLTGRCTWDPTWSRRIPITVDVPPPPAGQRAALWAASLDGRALTGIDAAGATAPFRLTAEQIARAAIAADQQALLADAPVTAEQLRAGARSQNGAALESRARRIEPSVGWEDLVLPAPCVAGLRELTSRVRNRDQVMDDWGMRPGGGRGRGITALFAGDSGTGKTMSAEVIATDLGLDLYTINLATVIDKYIGETEKNLERIFTEADGVNGVLLFDEADAIFGKRSEVRDAHDRYANVETAYLLQRMESFDGLAILATNLRANLDDAFTRRLDAVIDFPLPDESQRHLLWDRCLGPDVPRAPDLDLEFCGRQFALSGGNIRSIALTAAYLAAAAGSPVSMHDLIRATQREYRKLGRLCVRSEFGAWIDATGG